ncbi:MAG TPA: DUF2975 domain-containing protein [Candidatus Paceibacterota bacterium]
MKKSPIVFLQAVIVLMGIVALAIMIRFPQTEGRAANLDLFSIYTDLFIVYMYLASTAFFVALHQAFKLLGYIGQNKVFSPNSVKALRTIKYCAMILIGFFVGAEGYIFIVSRKVEEDIAGGVMMGVILIFVSAVVATAAAVFERILQSVVAQNLSNPSPLS